ncbi:MFS transporter [Streptomyces sp. S1A1-8]|nr:MFS transporter [Streptomyces sp. S1A1-8]QDO35776.1 MFS transporter [Streptomyces sp. S1A1-3]
MQKGIFVVTSASSTLPATSGLSRKALARAVGAATIGNALEWFDWSTYSAFAAIFSLQIFGGHGGSALLSALAVFGVGFLMRPLGGALIGAFADRHGRRSALVLSVVLMAAGSLLVGITPTFAQAGMWAPAVLTLARLIQGLSVGGDYGASPIFLSEIAPPRHRGLVSSLHYVSLTFGLLAASLLGWILSAVLTRHELATWGWRIPFLLGAAAALWGLYLRSSVQESALFVQARSQERPKDVPSARRTPALILRVIGMTSLGSIAFWTITSYLPNSAVHVLSAGSVFAASSWALLIFLALQPAVGWLSDRIGRKPLLISYSAGFLILGYPLVAGVRIGSAGTLFWVMLLGLIVFSGYSAISAAFLAEQFPTKTRSTGVGIAHNVSSALFGGTAPYLLAKLDQSGDTAWFAGYVMAAAVVSGVLFLRIPEARGKALDS